MDNRCYDEMFLQSCHRDVAAVFKLWQSKTVGSMLPGRHDIDPTEMKKYLPSIMLVDIEHPGPRFRYRLVGTGEVNHRGKDPTGMYLEDAYSGVDGGYCDSNYRYVAETGKHLFDTTPEPTTFDNMAKVEVIFLPLASDGQTVDKVLVFSVVELAPDERLMTYAGVSNWAKDEPEVHRGSSYISIFDGS